MSCGHPLPLAPHIVDDNIERAKALHRALDGILHCLGLPHIKLYGKAACACPAALAHLVNLGNRRVNRARQTRVRVGRLGGNGDIRTLRRQHLANLEADAARCARAGATRVCQRTVPVPVPVQPVPAVRPDVFSTYIKAVLPLSDSAMAVRPSMTAVQYSVVQYRIVLITVANKVRRPMPGLYKAHVAFNTP